MKKIRNNYFDKRLSNDLKRMKSFELEKDYIKKFVKNNFNENCKILDMGSSTGEMLDYFKVNKKNTICIENNEFAKNISKEKGYTVYANILEIPEDIFFDIVIFRGTIQYFPSPTPYYLEDKRRL